MPFLSYVLTILLAMVVDANYWIHPKSVALSARKVWCADQLSSCPLICKQSSTGAFQNTCDPKSLAYNCVCDDLTKPNMSEYSVTMPFHICLEWTNQCVEECPDHDAICQTDCREKHPCGARNPKRINATSTSPAKATKTADKTKIYDGPKDKEDKNDGEDDDVYRIHDHDGDEAGAVILQSDFMRLPLLIGGLFLGFALL